MAHHLDVFVDIHRIRTAAFFRIIARAVRRAASRRAMDVVDVVFGVRVAAPAFLAVLDTKIDGFGAALLADLREEPPPWRQGKVSASKHRDRCKRRTQNWR